MNLKQLPGGPASAPRAERPIAARVDATPATVPQAPQPAVSIKVSELATGTAVAAGPASLEDSELLQALKQRIQADDFQIDYAGLAGALVETALQAVGSRRGR